jgi:hypothetical protein
MANPSCPNPFGLKLLLSTRLRLTCGRRCVVCRCSTGKIKKELCGYMHMYMPQSNGWKWDKTTIMCNIFLYIWVNMGLSICHKIRYPIPSTNFIFMFPLFCCHRFMFPFRIIPIHPCSISDKAMENQCTKRPTELLLADLQTDGPLVTKCYLDLSGFHEKYHENTNKIPFVDSESLFNNWKCCGPLVSKERWTWYKRRKLRVPWRYGFCTVWVNDAPPPPTQLMLVEQ